MVVSLTSKCDQWLTFFPADEQHILLQCPQLNDLRHAYSHLFQIPGQTLTDLFDDHPPMLLAKYVRAALLMHQSVLQLP